MIHLLHRQRVAARNAVSAGRPRPHAAVRPVALAGRGFRAVFGVLLLAWVAASVSAASTVTVRPFKHRHPFITGGSGYSLYYGHINSLSAANRKLTYDWLFKDLNNEIIRPSFRDSENANDNNDPNVLDMSAITFSGQHDGMSALILEAKARNPRTIVMPYCSDFPDFLINTNSSGDITSLKLGDPNFYAEYAEWLYANMVYYQVSNNVPIDILDLFNEPDYDKPYLTKSICADILANAMPILRQLVTNNYATYGVKMPQISGPSCLGPGGSEDWLLNWQANPAAWTNFDILTCHPYGGGGPGFDYNLYAGIAGFKDAQHWRFIQNEMEFGHSSFINNGDSPLPVDALEDHLEGALALGRVFSISVLAGATDFMVFQGNGPQTGPKHLVHTPWAGTPERRKAYWVYKQLTTLQPYRSDVVDRTLSGSPTGFHANTFHKWGDNRVFVTLVNATTSAESTTLVFKDPDGQDIPFYRIQDYETSETLNMVQVGDTNFNPTATQWTTSVAANSVRSFVVHLAARAFSASQITYLREWTSNNYNTTPQDADTDPDHEVLAGHNGHGVRGTSKGIMRTQMEFDLDDAELAPGDTFVSSRVQLTAYRGTIRSSTETGGAADTIAFDLYEYLPSFVETNSTWEDPDGDGNPSSGDTVSGGTLGSLVVSTPAISGDDGDYNANGSSEVFDLPVAFSGAPLDAAVTGAFGEKLRFLMDPNEAVTGASRFMGFYDEDTTKAGGAPFLSLTTAGTAWPNLLINGGFDASPFTSGWTVTRGANEEQVSGMDGTGSGVRLNGNMTGLLRQLVASQPDFTCRFLTRIDETNDNSSLQLELADASGTALVRLRAVSGGVLQVQAGGLWLPVEPAGGGSPTVLSLDTVYQFQVVGRDFGTTDASWDLAWWPAADPLDRSAVSDIRVFTSPSGATAGSGVARLSFDQGNTATDTYTVDRAELYGGALASASSTHVLQGLSGPGIGFLTWAVNAGVDPSAGFNAIAILDPESDLLTALFEYAFGLSLSVVEPASGWTPIDADPSGGVLTIVVRNDDPNLRVAVETTTDLAGWTELPPESELPGVDQTGVPAGMVRRSFTLPGPDLCFARIRVSIP